MKIVLLSGGSGKRLWPLSNEICSKQFLKVLRNEMGNIESMLQRVCRQLRAVGVENDVIITAGLSQAKLIRNQLGEDFPLVVEPQRYNTFPAIVLSTAYLYFEKQCSLDESIIVLPVDLYVEQDYFSMLYKLDTIVQNDVANIVLMGTYPTYPSEKYGYIIPRYNNSIDEEDNGLSNIFPVLEFKEKPDIYNAQKYMEMGAFWNCGVFAFKLSYLMKIIQSQVVCHCYADIKEHYANFERTSFDYAVVEKEKSVAVVAYKGEWKDIGTWNTLTEVMQDKFIGNVKVSSECENVHVINELEIPMLVMGMKNMVVISSRNGILVSDKKQSQYIKQYIKDEYVEAMFEEHAWGECTILDISKDVYGRQIVTRKKNIYAKKCIKGDKYQDYLQIWTILSGKASILIGEIIYDAVAGSTFTIKPGIVHCLETQEDTILLEMQINEFKENSEDKVKNISNDKL